MLIILTYFNSKRIFLNVCDFKDVDDFSWKAGVFYVTCQTLKVACHDL